MDSGDMGEEGNDQMSDYSEDFEEEMESEVRGAARPAAVAAATHVYTPKQSKQTREEHAPGMRPTPRNVKSHPVRRRLNDHRKLKVGSRTFSEPRFLSKVNKSTPQRVYGHGKFPGGPSPRDRVLSAKQHTIKMLQNEVADAKRELEEMKKENRLLNRLQVRQEKELGKFQGQEGELPQILLRHAEEVRVMREQLRRSQEAAGGYQRKLNDLRQELLRVSDRKKKLEEVVRKKHLLEREALTIQLQEANDSIEDKHRKITELGRNLDLMVKNHSQEMRTLLQKNRALHQEAEGLRDTAQRVHAQLREKEKEVDIMNIYSQRIVRSVPQSNLPRLQAPAVESAESQTELSCSPSKIVSLQTRPHLRTAGSQTEMQLPKQPISPLKKLVPAETQTEVPVQPQALQKKLETQSDIHANAHSNNTNITSPKTVGASTVHKLPTTGDGKQQPPEAKPTKKDKPHDAAAKSGGQGPVDAEQQKKDFLLAKLKTLDAQKGPPSSQSMSHAKSSAESTSNTTASADHTGTVAPPTTNTVGNKMATRQQKPSESHSEQQKKKLLLAKLMAIDEGSDPSKVIPSKPTVPAKPDKRPLEVPSSATHSSSSLHSWPDTVENMYRGKPAYSTEGDPFGVQHSASKLSATTRQSGSGKRTETSVFLTESETESTHRPKFGRRQQEEASLVRDSNKVGQTEELQVKSAAKPPEAENYMPSFERRARNVAPKPKNEFVFGGQDRGPPVFGGLESRSGLKGPLLPMRPKAEPVMRGLDVMPGALGEPDDIEELVL